jgi:CRISPR-associated protein (TIGR03985 family)
MTIDYFDYPSSVELLRWLTRGSLKQNLAKALRLWVILRSLYGDDGDEVKLQLGEEFTFTQWRNLFFTEAEIHHKRDIIPLHHDSNCRCGKILEAWLFESSLSINRIEWCEIFQQYYPIETHELKILLSTGMASKKELNSDIKNNIPRKPLPEGRLFGVTGKNLESHFAELVKMGWLQHLQNFQGKNENNKFCKVVQFPHLAVNSKLEDKIETEQFTNLELGVFNNNLAQQIRGKQRFLIHVEYIVHQKLSNKVELLQKQLKNIWNQENIPFVKLKYRSAKLFQDMVDCIVYPVCIYYYQRALYLFAYGQTPRQDIDDAWSKIDWYDFRLERISELEELREIPAAIPQHFLQKCQSQNPPSPEEIKSKMADAWGFEFYQPQELMLLRFDQYFYGNYIEGTERDEMFMNVSHQQAQKIIASNTKLEWEEKQNILSTFAERKTKDIYCKINYRTGDNNIIMRLRAWGPNVEVFLPGSLRKRMTEDIHAMWKMYP